MNILQQGAAWLGDQLKSATGVPVTYTRGVTELPLTATPAQHEYEVFDEKAGLMTSVLMYDWTFTTADFGALVPQRGDKITANSQTFEVLPLDKKPHYEWLDTSGILSIVHTKRIA